MKPNKIAPVQRKAEAHLASDPELRESAQRAFQSYLKSVFLMRDKNTFDVFALCIRSGNACVLKGSPDARDSNRAIVALNVVLGWPMASAKTPNSSL